MNISFPHEKNKPLSKLSTFGIGGPAKYYAEAKTTADFETLLSFAHLHEIPTFILGKGSNCLFDDRGFDGLVIHNRIDYLSQNEGIFTVGGGFSFARLGQITAKLGWRGLEFAAGIPATVGGAVYMNAGANGQETKDSLVQVIYLNEKGEKLVLQKKDLFFAYRISSFQSMSGAIVEATFQLSHDENAKMNQKKIVDYRLHTQPYQDKSAGCAFRNPESFSAGRLIDECGLKGLRVGDAEVSLMHANFIVNRGNASSDEVRNLIQIVKEKVYTEKKILLEEEIRYISPYGISR